MKCLVFVLAATILALSEAAIRPAYTRDAIKAASKVKAIRDKESDPWEYYYKAQSPYIYALRKHENGEDASIADPYAQYIRSHYRTLEGANDIQDTVSKESIKAALNAKGYEEADLWDYYYRAHPQLYRELNPRTGRSLPVPT